MRVTAHNGRSSKKDGAYLPGHNDRVLGVGDHVDTERSKGNAYLNIYQHQGVKSFKVAEERFYREHFQEALDSANAKHIERRQRGRVRSMDAYRRNPHTCPEEVLYYVGDKAKHADPDLLRRIVNAQLSWESKVFPQVKYIDFALHVDEAGAPHVHARRVWIGHDEVGREVVSQAKALAEMGVERPDPTKPQGRYNCPKMAHSKACREHLVELCLKHGLDIDVEPRSPSKAGLDLLAYKVKQEQEKLAQVKSEATRLMRQAQQSQRDGARLRLLIKELCKTPEGMTVLNRVNSRVNEAYPPSLGGYAEAAKAAKAAMPTKAGREQLLNGGQDLTL